MENQMHLLIEINFKMKRIILLLCIITLGKFAKAQTPLLDSARAELLLVNSAFDSSQYLAFNLDISYRSDSVNSTVETDQMSGNYVLNKKNLYSNMGGTEYIQTDSFSYTIYSGEKMMIMARNFVGRNSDAFPLRLFIDSVVHYYSENFNIVMDSIPVDSVNSFKRISFIHKSSTTTPLDSSNYIKFLIEYNPDSYLPQKFEFGYKEKNATEDSIPITVEYYKTVSMLFSHYHVFNQTGIFDDAQYIIYDRQRKIYEPNDKYKEYKFMTAGFENEDEESQFYREVPAGSN